jgi:hypothetical protein
MFAVLGFILPGSLGAICLLWWLVCSGEDPFSL